MKIVDQVWVKETEGEGYISGDRECWCIHPWSFDEWNRVWDAYYDKVDEHNGDYDAVEEPPQSIYPHDLFPEGVRYVKDKGDPRLVDYSKKVRYKIRVEIVNA